MSVDAKARILILVNKKNLPDGSVLQKVERYSKQGLERSFIKDGFDLAGIIQRLNLWRSDENWLAMKPLCAGNYYYDG